MSMNHFYTVTNMCENNVQSSKVYSFSLCPSFSPLSVFSFTVGFGEVEHCGPKKKKVSHDRLPECSREGLRAKIFLSKK